MADLPVGGLSWERAGGPPLSIVQRLALLAGSVPVVVGHFAGKLAWSLTGRRARVREIDLARWAPPDSAIAKEATAHLRAVSSPAMVGHSLRTYWFSAIQTELAGLEAQIDKEVLYVAAVLHDVGLFEANPPGDQHCFTVGGAREVRRIAAKAGWSDPKPDRAALAITSNLNASVPIADFGPEAHVMSRGGQVEVFAQEWKVHPANLAFVLDRYPRDGFAADSLKHVAQERRRNPSCRFDCLHPIFPWMVASSHFSLDRR